MKRVEGAESMSSRKARCGHDETITDVNHLDFAPLTVESTPTAPRRRCRQPARERRALT